MGNFLKLTGAVTAGSILAAGVIKSFSWIGSKLSKDDKPADDPKDTKDTKGNGSK